MLFLILYMLVTLLIVNQENIVIHHQKTILGKAKEEQSERTVEWPPKL